jgi:hypothetical protein
MTQPARHRDEAGKIYLPVRANWGAVQEAGKIYLPVRANWGAVQDRYSFINNIFTMARWEQAGFGMRLVRDENGAPLDSKIIDELQRVEERLTHPVSWRSGDILMVDNTRMLHGRRAFKDTSRSIFVRLGGELQARSD